MKCLEYLVKLKQVPWSEKQVTHIWKAFQNEWCFLFCNVFSCSRDIQVLYRAGWTTDDVIRGYAYHKIKNKCLEKLEYRTSRILWCCHDNNFVSRSLSYRNGIPLVWVLQTSSIPYLFLRDSFLLKSQKWYYVFGLKENETAWSQMCCCTISRFCDLSFR